MDPVTITAIGAVVVAALSLAGAAYSARKASASAARASAVEEKKVDAEAYARAQAILTETIERLEAEVHRLEAELLQTRRELDVERSMSTQYATRVRRLEAVIRDAGLPLPSNGG